MRAQKLGPVFPRNGVKTSNGGRSLSWKLSEVGPGWAGLSWERSRVQLPEVAAGDAFSVSQVRHGHRVRIHRQTVAPRNQLGHRQTPTRAACHAAADSHMRCLDEGQEIPEYRLRAGISQTITSDHGYSHWSSLYADAKNTNLKIEHRYRWDQRIYKC